jgi:hypothetical protein
MNISILASRDDLEQALNDARTLITLEHNTHLNATVNAGLLGRLDTVWETIEGALRKGYKFGSEAARDALEIAIAQAELLIADAGTLANEFHQALLEKLHLFVKGFIRSAMQRVPDSLAIAGRNFRIARVTCTQKIVLTGSLEINLTQVVSLASNGELELAVDYEVDTAQSEKALPANA